VALFLFHASCYHVSRFRISSSSFETGDVIEVSGRVSSKVSSVMVAIFVFIGACIFDFAIEGSKVLRPRFL